MAGTITVDKIQSDTSYNSTVNVVSALVVSNTATFANTLGVTGATTLSSTLAAGNTTITGTLSASAKLTLSGVTNEAMKLTASASGTNGAANYINWYRADGTTSKGYIGYASADTTTFTIGNELGGNIALSGATTLSSTLNVTGITTLGQVKNGASFTSINGTTPDNLFGGGSGSWAMGLTNAASGGTPYGLGIKYTVDSPNGTSSFFLLGEDASNSRFYMRSNGGLVNYSGNNSNLSDRREKTNFLPATSYLDKICAIPVQTFNYIDQNLENDPGLTLGVVAQDVLLVAPELVMESNWAPQDQPEKLRYSIYQTDMQYALMKCIQEQQVLIKGLTDRIASLEEK